MKEPKPLTINVGIVLFLAIMAVGSFYRLHELSLMAYHHDESIHEYYSYELYRYGPGSPQLARSSPPYYNAVYHGPFLYHWSALFFFLFGDNDFTGRLPFAVYGIAMLWIAYMLKIVVGQRKALIITLFCALSPTLTYFSRFARNDVFVGTDNLAMVAFTLWYFKTGKVRYLFLTALAAVFCYCTKENSYVGGAVLCGFLVLYCIAHLIFADKEKRASLFKKIFSDFGVFTYVVLLYGIFSATVVGYVYLNVHHGWFPKHKDSLSFWIYWGSTFLSALAIYYIQLTIRMRFLSKEMEESDSRDSIVWPLMKDVALLFSVLAVIIGTYALMFTVCFTSKKGLIDGVYLYIAYWMKMHGNPRIPGPPSYHVYRLLFYEPMAMFLLVVAAIYYLPYRISMWVTFRNDPERAKKYPLPHWFPIFFLLWSVFALWIYSVLQEKVQWLLYHQSMPLLVLAGFLVGELHERMGPGVLRKCLWILISIFLVYQVRATTLCTHYEPDDPRELLVYTQTNSDLPKVVKEIDVYADRLRGMGEKTLAKIRPYFSHDS